MSEKFERIQLSDDDVQNIAGGELHYIQNPQQKIFWSDENPDVVYTFNQAIDILDYLARNRLLNDPDDSNIQKLLEAGIIW